MNANSEENLILHAEELLVDDTEVLAAGNFCLARLWAAASAGVAAGAVVGDAVNPFDTTATSEIVGALGGKHLAMNAAAEEAGATVHLLLAVTADDIYVFNDDTGGRLPTIYARFPRATVEMTFTKLGLSRVLALTDPATGTTVELLGSVSWLAAKAQGDKVVFEVLGVTAHHS